MSPNEPRSVFTAAQSSRSQLKCPRPRSTHNSSHRCPGGHGVVPVGTGTGASPGGVTVVGSALGVKQVQGRGCWRKELVSVGQGRVTGCPQHWLSQLSCPPGHGHSCPLAVQSPLATSSPVSLSMGSPVPWGPCPIGSPVPMALGSPVPRPVPSSVPRGLPTLPHGDPSHHLGDNSLRAMRSFPRHCPL